MDQEKSVSTPMAIASHLSLTDVLNFLILHSIEALYAVSNTFFLTQPNVAFTVNKVYQFMHTSKLPH